MEIRPSDLKNKAFEVVEKAQARLNEKGKRHFYSNHECLGIITEEYHELIDAVKSNDDSNVYAELLDIAVGCIVGMSSLGGGFPMNIPKKDECEDYVSGATSGIMNETDFKHAMINCLEFIAQKVDKK